MYSRRHRFIVHPRTARQAINRHKYAFSHGHGKHGVHTHLVTTRDMDWSFPVEDDLRLIALLKHEDIHVTLDRIGERQASYSFDLIRNERLWNLVESPGFDRKASEPLWRLIENSPLWRVHD